MSLSYGKYRRVNKAERGVGTLIAAAFMILILLLGFSVFFLMRTGAEDYQETVESMNRLDFERSQEKAEITYFDWDTGSGNLTLVVKNTGSIEFELALIGVFDEFRQPVNATSPYTPIEPYILVNPQTSMTIGPYNFTLNEVNKTHIVQLTTKRGTVISQTYPILTQAYEFSGFFGQSAIGWVTITFEPESFQYTSTTVHPNTSNAWIIPLADANNLIFYVKLRNHAGYDLNLTQYSVMQLTIYKTGSVNSYPFYIVDNSSEWNDLEPYGTTESVILPAADCCVDGDCDSCPEKDIIMGGDPITVKFAAKDPLDDQFQDLSKAQYDMVIILYYEYLGEVIAQYVPFAGVIVTA